MTACRKRRIKCGEEKPTCGNCVKSKRVCEGYAQRVIFKNPLGIPGAPSLPQDRDPHLQQFTRVPLYNEHSHLPPQQAAAVAQHPMLAPRLQENTSTEYHPYPQADPNPTSDPSYPTNEPPFHYPPHSEYLLNWNTQPAQLEHQALPSTTSHQFPDQHGLHNPQVKIQDETGGPEMPQSITDWSAISDTSYNSQLYPQVKEAIALCSV